MDTSDQLLLNKLLASISEHKASDLHLVAGNFPIFRINGKLTPLESEQPLTAIFLNNIVDNWLDENQKKILNRDKKIVFSFIASNKMRFKISVYYQQGSLAISLKLIPQQIKNLLDLGLPTEVQQLADISKGLIIITGPFASGRSTTVSSLIEYINQNYAKHIVTIEKPVEYIYADNRSIIEQREVGKDAISFLSALQFAAQEDVDIVFLSEIQGPKIIQEIFQVINSGRLVLAVMNTENIITTLEQIIKSFPSDERLDVQNKLADVLTAIIAQKTLPSRDGKSIVVCESFFPDQTARTVIREGDLNKLKNVLYSPVSPGIVSFEKALAELVNKGSINLELGLKEADDKEHFKSLVNRS